MAGYVWWYQCLTWRAPPGSPPAPLLLPHCLARARGCWHDAAEGGAMTDEMRRVVALLCMEAWWRRARAAEAWGVPTDVAGRLAEPKPGRGICSSRRAHVAHTSSTRRAHAMGVHMDQCTGGAGLRPSFHSAHPSQPFAAQPSEVSQLGCERSRPSVSPLQRVTAHVGRRDLRPCPA